MPQEEEKVIGSIGHWVIKSIVIRSLSHWVIKALGYRVNGSVGWGTI